VAESEGAVAPVPDRTVAIIGGGPAGLMAAEVISGDPRLEVKVYDAMPSMGRKFLMAGRGGLNLTHSEPLEVFLQRYGARAEVLRPHVEALSPGDVRAWCEALGQPTYVGSSGRVFPVAMKASGLLRAWLRRLDARGVQFRPRHRWSGWDGAGQLLFETSAGQVAVRADATVLALGGATWPRLGSDGAWVPILDGIGVQVAPLQPSNSGFRIAWSDVFRGKWQGQPLKGIALSHGGRTVRGEAILTAEGIEGGAVYALSASLRDAVLAEGRTTLTVDLKPDMDPAALAAQLGKPRGKQSLATFLRKAARLSPVAIALLRESAFMAGQRTGDLSPERLAAAIKSVALPVTGVAPMARAISSAGGIRFEEIDADFMLRRRPGVFVAGEMLDWEAPTGGYLLQACFATGAAAGRGVIAQLGSRSTMAT
jgi:uncharacterized flavoprotein (TIGR03862 family)